jgi:glycerol-3-phosphate O-acyltransferase
VVANEKERGRKGGPAFEPIYAVPGDRRVALEYHKNTVLHFFVASALVASALFALGGEAERRALEARVRELSRLLKLEFQFRADAEFSTIFSDAVRGMVEAGELAVSGDSVRAAPGQGGRRAAMYAEMVRTYLEAYRWTLRAALEQPEGTLVTKKEFTRQLLASGTRAWFAGEVELRESVSRHKFENAIQLFVERGVLASDGEKLCVGRDGGAELRTLLDDHLRRE